MISKVGRNIIVIPRDVDVTFSQRVVKVSGKNGVVENKIPVNVVIVVFCNNVAVLPKRVLSDDAIVGTTFSLLRNTITGVCKGFSKTLVLKGVGYRAHVINDDLVLRLGYSHEILFKIPELIRIEVIKNTKIVVFGLSKQKVGHVAASIRGYRPPECYSGKGVCYEDEVISLKEVKKK